MATIIYNQYYILITIIILTPIIVLVTAYILFFNLDFYFLNLINTNDVVFVHYRFYILFV